MNLHSIAGLTVDMGYKYEKMINHAAAYRIGGEKKADMTIYLSDEFLEEKQRENPHLDLCTCEYLFTEGIFYTALLHFGGLVLHSSAVLDGDRAYLFSAPSGTGKSTHTRLWQKVYPDVKILNDDKPALRVTDGEVYAFGTPWSGESDLNLNTSAKVGGICFLERGEKNAITRIEPKAAIKLFINQTMRPFGSGEAAKMLELADKVLTSVPLYKMQCNMAEEAAKMSHGAMTERID